MAIFFTRPISGTLAVLALLSLFAPFLRVLWGKYRKGKTATA
jgi:TctA family transporter